MQQSILKALGEMMATKESRKGLKWRISSWILQIYLSDLKVSKKEILTALHGLKSMQL